VQGLVINYPKHVRLSMGLFRESEIYLRATTDSHLSSSCVASILYP
jgi:hypothetical protein